MLTRTFKIPKQKKKIVPNEKNLQTQILEIYGNKGIAFILIH